jgi:hypothetical protein
MTTEVSGWTGGCRDGKRDGPGILTVSSDSVEVATGIRSYAHRYELAGTFVDGKQVGLGCYVTPPICTMFGDDGGVGAFRKEPDGRWVAVDWVGSPLEPMTFAAPGALARESERLIAAVRQRVPIGRVRIPVVVAGFDDLLRGGAIVMAPTMETPPLQGKRVAIVLSARAVSELERYSEMRDTLISLSKRVRKSGREHREKFIAGSEPGRVVASVVAAVKNLGATAVPAEDLSAIATGAADYALVFDWRFTGNFALDAKQYAALPSCRDDSDSRTCYQFFRQSFSVWLVNSRLEAERFHDWDIDTISMHHDSGDQQEGYGQLFTRLGVIHDFDARFNIDDGDIRTTVDGWLKSPEAKPPPARFAKMAPWSPKALPAQPNKLLSPHFAAERADALASCSVEIKVFAAHFPGTRLEEAALIFEQNWLDDAGIDVSPEGIRQHIATVEAAVQSASTGAARVEGLRAGRCLLQRRLAQLEGVALVSGAVDGTLSPLSIGNPGTQWQQQGQGAHIIATDGKSAMDCMYLGQLSSGGVRVLVNNCLDEVEIVWCYKPGDCDTETGSGWTVPPGIYWPLSANKEIRWAACHGRETTSFVKGSHGFRYYCSAPASGS